MLLRRNKHSWYRFLGFLQVSIVLNSFTALPVPYGCSNAPDHLPISLVDFKMYQADLKECAYHS